MFDTQLLMLFLELGFEFCSFLMFGLQLTVFISQGSFFLIYFSNFTEVLVNSLLMVIQTILKFFPELILVAN